MASREELDTSDEGRLRRLEALDELLPLLSNALDIRDVFVRVSEIAQKVLPHDLVGLPLVDKDREHAVIHAVAARVMPELVPERRVKIPDPTLLTSNWDHILVADTLADPMERDRPPTQGGQRSLLRVPLRLRGEVLGALDFYSITPGFYQPSDVIVAKRIADHVVLALSHERLAEESAYRVQLEERAANLEMLDGLLGALTGALSLRDVFDRVSDIAQNVLTHDGMAVLVPTKNPTVADVYALRGYAGPTLTTTRIREPETLTRPWDYRIIADLPNDPIYNDTVAAKSGMHSSLAVPVRLEGKLEAILTFTSRQKAHFTRDDVLIARRIADHCALALSHERLAAQQHRSDELTARAANLDMLDELLVTLTGSGDLPEVWERVSSAAQKVLKHDALTLVALLPDGVHGRVYASKVPDVPPFSETVVVPRALIEHPEWEYELVDDLQARADQKHLEATERGFRAALRVPIRLDNELVAGLAFLSFTAGAYSEADVPVARRISDRMVVSFARERRRALMKSATEANERVSRLENRVRALTEELDARTGYRRVVGESPSWRTVLTQATQVAATETTALLLGESGTGKEVVARFLHRASVRKDGPFVALNCAALPDQLLEAELFGYERGAFTGAVNSKPGQLEQAGGGILFLDEVGEMSLPAQAKFLRVLQEREFQRLGGTRVLRTDARIVAATNRDLQKAIQHGQFREDLFYRLNVFMIHLPPLRDRREDILPLSEAFLKEIGRGLGRPPAGISRDARQRLIEYHWPGNVRELRNILERAAILCEGGLITAEHLALAPPRVPPPAVPVASEAPIQIVSVPPAPLSSDLQSMERSMIEQALKDARFNKSKAAKQLGLSRTQLYVRMRRYGLE